MKHDPRLNLVNQKMQERIRRVEHMPPGGDLEGLIEDGLSELDQMLYRELLARRQEAASDPTEAFSPSALPPLPTPDAPGAA